MGTVQVKDPPTVEKGSRANESQSFRYDSWEKGLSSFGTTDLMTYRQMEDREMG